MNEASNKKEYSSVEIAKIKEQIESLEKDNDSSRYMILHSENGLDGMRKGMGGYADSTRAYIEKIIYYEKAIKVNNSKILSLQEIIKNNNKA